MSDGENLPSKKPSETPAQLPKELQKILQNIQDKPTREKAISIVSQHIRSWGGPLPAPDTLKEYDVIIPGLAERIVKMAETQSAHRIELEGKVVNSQLSESKRGQYLGFIIAVICICATVWLSLAGHEAVAGVLGGTALVGLVTVFVVGKREQKADLSRKAGS